MLIGLQNNEQFIQNVNATSDELVRFVDYCNEQSEEIKKLDQHRKIRERVERLHAHIQRYSKILDNQISSLRGKVDEMRGEL